MGSAAGLQLPRIHIYNQRLQTCLQQLPSITECLHQRVSSLLQGKAFLTSILGATWLQKQSVPELGILWVSQTYRTGAMMETYTAIIHEDWFVC